MTHVLSHLFNMLKKVYLDKPAPEKNNGLNTRTEWMLLFDNQWVVSLKLQDSGLR